MFQLVMHSKRRTQMYFCLPCLSADEPILMRFTLAKHRPMVPVPQQISTTSDSCVTLLIWTALSYKIPAPAVFIYKKNDICDNFY